jgi:hypothetical protein
MLIYKKILELNLADSSIRLERKMAIIEVVFYCLIIFSPEVTCVDLIKFFALSIRKKDFRYLDLLVGTLI